MENYNEEEKKFDLNKDYFTENIEKDFEFNYECFKMMSFINNFNN